MLWRTESFEEEKARKNAELKPQFERECQWHRVFAWTPVTLGHFLDKTDTRTVWLCWVERRLHRYSSRRQPDWYFWDVREFEYRLPLGLEKS